MKREALIRKDLSWLKSYLTMPDEEKGREVASHYPEFLAKYLRVYPELKVNPTLSAEEVASVLDNAGSRSAELIELIPDEVMRQFYFLYSDDGRLLQDPDSPSFLYMRYLSTVRNQWLIHFTDNAREVRASGFKVGMNDLSKLGLTTWLTEDEKPGGYNFAYLLDDFANYGREDDSDEHEWYYGESALMFRASGIRIRHRLDAEPQVIFWGQSARDIVLLEPGDCAIVYPGYSKYRSYGWEAKACKSDKAAFCSDQLTKVVAWVKMHFEQYRRVLTCR